MWQLGAIEARVVLLLVQRMQVLRTEHRRVAAKAGEGDEHFHGLQARRRSILRRPLEMPQPFRRQRHRRLLAAGSG